MGRDSKHINTMHGFVATTTMPCCEKAARGHKAESHAAAASSVLPFIWLLHHREASNEPHRSSSSVSHGEQQTAAALCTPAYILLTRRHRQWVSSNTIIRHRHTGTHRHSHRAEVEYGRAREPWDEGGCCNSLGKLAYVPGAAHKHPPVLPGFTTQAVGVCLSHCNMQLVGTVSRCFECIKGGAESVCTQYKVQGALAIVGPRKVACRQQGGHSRSEGQLGSDVLAAAVCCSNGATTGSCKGSCSVEEAQGSQDSGHTHMVWDLHDRASTAAAAGDDLTSETWPRLAWCFDVLLIGSAPSSVRPLRTHP